MLGGKPPKRGGKLTGGTRDRPQLPARATELLIVIGVGCLVLGGVVGFSWGMDRQVRGGILAQRAEAMSRPDWIRIGDLPAYVPDAFRTVVEPRHAGDAIARMGRVGGAISRELVRQIHLLNDDIVSEARALVMAPVLEQRLSDRELLELYLNRAYLGRIDQYPIYGVHHAALEYFGKAPSTLTVGEAATLAGLLLRPRIARPNEVPGAVGARRNEVLAILLASGEITPAMYSAAIAEPLGFQPGITELPMTRWITTFADTSVVRLPEEFRPVPDTATVQSP